MEKRRGFPGAVNYRVLSVLLIGFGTLAALIAMLWFSAAKRAEQIYRDATVSQETYRQVESILHRIRSDIFLSGIVLRDYLLDESPAPRPYRQEAQRIKASMEGRLDELDSLLVLQDRELLAHLRQQVDAFWDLRERIFAWTPDRKKALSRDFLEHNTVPQRNAILSITGEIGRLRAANYTQEQLKTKSSWAGFRTFLSGMFSIALLVAGIVAAVSIFRILRLEQRAEGQRLRTEQAEEGLRRLSQQLVQTQEDERKAISRELHDEIGQMLTALRIELGNLDSLRNSANGEFQAHLADSKALAEDSLRSVRNLATGLRPAMLDHLGLGPALQWQAREFSVRTQIEAMAQIDPNLPDLPEAVCICIYRIVQESLTNCARHAKANKVRVSVQQAADEIAVVVQDDGIGFDPALGTGRGLGLIGMRERVKKLGGTMAISSRVQKGTLLEIRLPAKPAGLSGGAQGGQTASVSADENFSHEVPTTTEPGRI